MAHHEFDVLILSDLRYPGGNSTAIAEEVRAAAAAGYRLGLMHLAAANLTQPFPVNPRIKEVVEAGLASIVAPEEAVTARLAAIHNPHVVRLLPARALKIEAEQRLVVVQHPPLSADGEPYYELAQCVLHANLILGGEVPWAPVGPLVRRQFVNLPHAPRLHDEDWYNIVDPSLWCAPREKLRGTHPVIGRHSRPDLRKWPETREALLEAYPDDPRLLVRILGGSPSLHQLAGGYPSNWKVWSFNAWPPRDFLKTIDFFVYYHHPNWVEAFGCTIIEAMASGAVAILPAHFEALFGEAAIYSPIEDVLETVLRWHADHAAYKQQSDRALEIVRARFSHAAHQARLERLIGPPRRSSVPIRGSARLGTPRRVLFVSSNGVGMGHVTRLLAIARRLPADVEPVFATMSQGLHVISDMGFMAEYLPYHEYLRCEINLWNRHLRRELAELCRFYGAHVVVFDGNCPFQGVIDSALDNPHIWYVWCRRGMWQAGTGELFLSREGYFDAVLEPTDYAGAFDAGLTPKRRGRARLVKPITLLDLKESLPREAARRELGLDLDKTAILLLLGAGNNYDFGPLRSMALETLGGRDEVEVASAQWIIAQKEEALPKGVIPIKTFPLARLLDAFDGAISVVGYNSFHELLQHRIPTIFVPNENPRQDDQLARARWAERSGMAMCVRTLDPYSLKPALARLLDEAEREAMRRRCATLDVGNGAYEAATMITEMAYSARNDSPRG